MSAIKITDLSKIYRDGENSVKAVDNVSLEIDKGEFLALTGASGSGKSTLLHIIGGVDIPTNGGVIVNGIALHELKEPGLTVFKRRNIGLIYQFYNLVPTLSVRENIILPLLLDNKNVDEDDFADIINTLDLKNRLEHMPNQLSGGQQQRTAIGRALISKPAVILADEPTGNLDKKNSKEIIELFKTANKKYRQTLIIVTHDESIAAQANRVVTMEDGRIIKDKVTV